MEWNKKEKDAIGCDVWSLLKQVCFRIEMLDLII